MNSVKVFVLMAGMTALFMAIGGAVGCLLYTSDAADERSSVDLGGRRIIKKKKNISVLRARSNDTPQRRIDTNDKTETQKGHIRRA